MAVTVLRGVFDDAQAAGRATGLLRERGLDAVQVSSEPISPSAQAGSPRTRGALFGLSLLIGAALGALFGLMVGYPFLGLPSVRADASSALLTLLVWMVGGGVLGALAGALIGTIYATGAGRRAGAAVAPATDQNGQPQQVVVTVQVAEEARAEEARRLLRELHARVEDDHTHGLLV